MAYTTNPKMPKLRAKAVEMVRSGNSIRQVSRYFGYSVGAIHSWCKKAPWPGVLEIPTDSSRPNSHPKSLNEEMIKRIIEIRKERGRCAEIVHEIMLREGCKVSLSSVKRTLERAGLIKKRNHLKRHHDHIKRPHVFKPGDLLQIDTIHIGPSRPGRLYIYTLIDLFSRWAWAVPTQRINTHKSAYFIRKAQINSNFEFTMIQSDNGSEFSQNFTERIKITHRHSRVRRSNDNAHVERFNRTIQEECLDRVPETMGAYTKAISEYLDYYNNERLHLGINKKTPSQIISECSQAID